jgi:hypothetical protein
MGFCIQPKWTFIDFKDVLFLSLDWMMVGYLMEVLEYQVFFSVELHKHCYVMSTCHEREGMELEGLKNINKHVRKISV